MLCVYRAVWPESFERNPLRIMESMAAEASVLQRHDVRLEPLEPRHIDGVVAAAAADAFLYQWSPVPRGKTEATK